MKTIATTQAAHEAPAHRRFPRTGRLLLAGACASLVSFAAPTALAAGINADYEIKSVNGSLKASGRSVDIPDKLIKKILGAKKGAITIEDSKLDLRKRAMIDIVEEFGDDVGIDVDASVTGPAYVRFTKNGDSYRGRASGKIITELEATVLNHDFSGELKTKVTARVENKRLKVVISFSGEFEGEDFSGRVVIDAKR